MEALSIFDYKNSQTFDSPSKTVEITRGEYKGVQVTETHVNPAFWGKKPTTTYLVDMIFPMGKFDCLSDAYYTAEGYGMPVFNKLEDAINFINLYKS